MNITAVDFPKPGTAVVTMRNVPASETMDDVRAAAQDAVRSAGATPAELPVKWSGYGGTLEVHVPLAEATDAELLAAMTVKPCPGGECLLAGSNVPHSHADLAPSFLADEDRGAWDPSERAQVREYVAQLEAKPNLDRLFSLLSDDARQLVFQALCTERDRLKVLLARQVPGADQKLVADGVDMAAILVDMYASNMVADQCCGKLLGTHAYCTPKGA